MNQSVTFRKRVYGEISKLLNLYLKTLDLNDITFGGVVKNAIFYNII